ncbi:hypothetical protein AMTR_s00020p00087450 [Amborella trichopoda]|uniref:Uncharacterized protein n=1 Tax=Amborella trichopoda TaxID=13333 RepID=W1PVJ2_AMBTC|nr:hypothetical protein AMTR_s00020p00087450 [Amborella trichopoda]
MENEVVQDGQGFGDVVGEAVGMGNEVADNLVEEENLDDVEGDRAMVSNFALVEAKNAYPLYFLHHPEQVPVVF